MTAPRQPLAERTPWDDACLAAAALATDPSGLGGLVLRARAGPVRDAWFAHWRTLLATATPVRGVPLHVDDARLLGGLDLVATLNAGRPMRQQGLLEQASAGFVVLAMAERISGSTAAKIAGVLDDGSFRLSVIACDEGTADEQVTRSLSERLALHVDLDAVSMRDLKPDDDASDADAVAAARGRLATVTVDDAIVEALCAAAAALGITSLRAPLQAVRLARVLAALDGRHAVTAADASRAAGLVLSSRARNLPAPPPDEAPSDAPPAEPEARDADASPEEPGDAPRQETMDEVVLDAAVASIPAGLLEQLARGARSRVSSASNATGAGASSLSRRRGAPAGVRRRKPRGDERLSLVETLRAAAPWQRIRRAERGASDTRVQVRADDLHVVRFNERHPTTTVFVVDASGSSALHRLAEAKGAVELLLADCYVRRDSVAVVAFRGREAQVVLPPTRSLARAKRSLAGMPGGGGTPLAHALDLTRELIVGLRRRGETALAVLLTDGRANVARDGSGGRERADSDALAAARALRAIDADVVLIDTSPQPHERAGRLAAEMAAVYRALPHAGAREMSEAVRQASRR